MVLSTLLQNRMVLFPISEPRSPLPFPSELRGFSLFLLQNHMALFLSPQNLVVPSLSTCFRTSWFSHLLQSRVVYYLLQSRMVYSLFTSEPRGLPLCMAAGPRYKSQCPYSFAAPVLTPLQPVTPASILVFFYLFWAAIVSLGRCGPMAWSQSSPSSPTGPVTRGSCFPVPSWVEFGPIPLAQSMATAT